MTEQEKAELNRRVAVAMGWQSIRETERDVYRGNVLGFATTSVTVGISPRAGGNAGMPEEIPDFATDPSASDLVRQEVERRGWRYFIQRWENGWDMEIYHDNFSDVFVRSGESYYEVLCLAFLAAVDAEKEQKP